MPKVICEKCLTAKLKKDQFCQKCHEQLVEIVFGACPECWKIQDAKASAGGGGVAVAEQGSRAFFTVSQAARWAGVSRTHMYDLVVRKLVPAVRFGGAIRIPTDKLDQWIDAQLKA